MNNLFHLESRMFKSLANPKRLEILHLLQSHSLTVNQIVEMSGVPQANVSQHLMVLRKLRLVIVQKDAQERRYSLYSPAVLSICRGIRQILLEQYKLNDNDDETINRMRLYKDPVCGMMITSHDAAGSSLVKGKRYYFCALGCEKKFRKQGEIN